MAKYSVTAVGDSPTLTTVTSRDLTFKMDQPAAMGGTNEGMTPTEILLGALVGCLNVVIHMIAKERGITVNSLKMDAEGELNPKKFMGRKTDERAGFKSIDVKVALDADTDEATKEAIVAEALLRCPVSDNLAAATVVNEELAGAYELVG